MCRFCKLGSQQCRVVILLEPEPAALGRNGGFGVEGALRLQMRRMRTRFGAGMEVLAGGELINSLAAGHSLTCCSNSLLCLRLVFCSSTRLGYLMMYE